MNNSISAVSILILFSLFYFFIYEMVTIIRIANKKIKGNMALHIMGTITTFLMTICVAFSIFGVNYDSNLFILITVILVVLFYIGFAWQTLFEIKK